VTVDARITSSRCCAFLRDDPSCKFVNFIDICGVDYPAREKRFDVVYHLLSPYQNAAHPREGRDR
jgi:NADH:ubiquinone oxidoreductase subunit C